MHDNSQQTATQTLGRVDYLSYIHSDEWKERRVLALKRSVRRSDSGRDPACELCGLPGLGHNNRRSELDYKDRRLRVENSKGLEVHHLHYLTLGVESPDDLIVLCTDILYYGMRDAAMRIARREGDPLPPPPERVGCHERCHDDPVFRAAVERIAATRIR